MTLRQQQLAVFVVTVVIIFGLFSAGVWLIAQRLTTEATLQTALVMARQVEIALADSLRERPAPQPRVVRPQTSSFWSFLGKIFPGAAPKPIVVPGRAPSRHTEVRGLMRAFVDRSGGIEAMWVLNASGEILYSSTGHQKGETLNDSRLRRGLAQGVTTIQSKKHGQSTYYDVLVPLEMPQGVKGPGGLRLWVNPGDWTEMLAGLWRQLTLLFVLGGAIALFSALLTTALYTRRFRLISDALRQAEAGTYQVRPAYASRDEVGASLDLIDRLVMKQRKATGAPAPLQRLSVAARTLAHEVRTPLNALGIHLELLRQGWKPNPDAKEGQVERSLQAVDASVRQVSRLIRDFTDYSGPVAMEHKSVDAAAILHASLEAITVACATQKIAITKEIPPGPWNIQGDATRLRQAFDNLLKNAMEAQPDGGSIHVAAAIDGARLVLRIADAGPGVPPELRDAMFEFGKTSKSEGSGIGLPLSQLIVESHGGSLVYEGGNGGASFRLTLPLEVNG